MLVFLENVCPNEMFCSGFVNFFKQDLTRLIVLFGPIVTYY